MTNKDRSMAEVLLSTRACEIPRCGERHRSFLCISLLRTILNLPTSKVCIRLRPHFFKSTTQATSDEFIGISCTFQPKRTSPRNKISYFLPYEFSSPLAVQTSEIAFCSGKLDLPVDFTTKSTDLVMQEEKNAASEATQNTEQEVVHIHRSEKPPAVEASTPGNGLQFQAFSSAVDASFWRALAKKKLDEYKLSDSPQGLFGHYSASRHAMVGSLFNMGDYSFNLTPTKPADACSSPVTLINCNTMEAFKAIDKAALLQQQGDALWADIESGRAVQSPMLLTRTLLLTFAMIKEHRYYYWFAFPALNVRGMNIEVDSPAAPLSTLLSASALASFSELYQRFKAEQDDDNSGFFLVRVQEDKTEIHPLSAFKKLQAEGTTPALGFVDPCQMPTNPGWPLRNYLLMAAHCFELRQATVICYRHDAASSVTLRVNIQYDPEVEVRKAVGWERNNTNKLGPRLMDLQPFMDPAKLAESSVDLNIKLMRWRAL